MRMTRQRLRDEGGFGVIAAVIVGFVVITGGITMLSLAVHQSEGSAKERDRERAFAAAEAAVNDAMSMMSFDPQNCPGLDARPPKRVIVPGEYEYEVTFVLPVDATYPTGNPAFACSDNTTLDRYIVARAWVPSEAAPQAQRRQVEQQIRLKPLDGFEYALFAAPGGVSAGQRLKVNGDIYADHDLVLEQHTDVFGDVIGQQKVTVANNTTIAGDLWTLGDTSLDGVASLVQGDVKSSGGPVRNTDSTDVVPAATYAGNIVNKGTIDKKAISPAAITGTGTFGGGKVTSNVDQPPRRSLPTFDPNPPAVTYDNTYSDDAAFEAMANGTDFAGTYRVTDGDTVNLDRTPKFRVVGGQRGMLVAAGPIQLSTDLTSTTSATGTFVLVSLATSNETSATPSILLSQQQTFPPNVNVVLFAPNGCVKFENLKEFSGVVYAKCLLVGNQFTLTYQDPGTIPGFDWTAASATRFEIEAYTFREVRFQP